MKSRMVASLLTLTMAVVLLARDAPAQNNQNEAGKPDGIAVPITGTTSKRNVTMSGTFTLQRFAADPADPNGILAVGVVRSRGEGER